MIATSPDRRPVLRGRTRECVFLDGLIADIRRGGSRSLVLHGEAGIGKTALLEYLIAKSSDFTVVRASGVESEMELAYSGLHQLCGTILDRLEKLPAPQRLALEIVFGLSAGPTPSSFSWPWRCLACCRKCQRSVRCCVWLTTRTGWIRARR